MAIFLFFHLPPGKDPFYLCPCLCPYPFPYRDDCSAGLSFSQSLLHPSRQRKQNIAIFSQAILENKNIISNLLQRSTFEVYQCYPRLIFRLSESSVLSTRLFLHLNPFSWRCWAGPRKFHGFFTFAIRTLIAWTSFIWSDFRGRSWPRWWQWHFFWTNISKRLRLHIVPTHSWHNKSIKQWNIIWTQILKACSFFSLRIKKWSSRWGRQWSCRFSRTFLGLSKPSNIFQTPFNKCLGNVVLQHICSILIYSVQNPPSKTE